MIDIDNLEKLALAAKRCYEEDGDEDWHWATTEEFFSHDVSVFVDYVSPDVMLVLIQQLRTYEDKIQTLETTIRGLSETD